MTKYALPHPLDTIVDVEFSEDRLSIIMNTDSVELIKTSKDICLVRNKEKFSAQHDLVGSLVNATGLEQTVADSVIRRFLELNFGFQFSKALEEWFIHAHPLLAEFAITYPEILETTALPRRLEIALRQPKIRDAARIYWGEVSCGAEAGKAFGQALIINGKISEVFISWMGLAPPTLRAELVTIEPCSSPAAMAVTPACRAVLVNLTPRTALEVVRGATQDPSMPLTILAAHKLGFVATGRDPKRILNEIKSAALRHDYGRCRDFCDFLIRRGLEGKPVTELKSRHDLVVAGKVLANCLNNPTQPYLMGVEMGHIRVLCIGDDWGLGAVAFNVANRPWRLIEAKGPNNDPLNEDLHSDLRNAFSEWETLNASSV
jgi:hypothetical protein